MNVLAPPQVMVEPFGDFAEDTGTPGLPGHTALYREGTDIDAALGLAVEQLPEGSPLIAVSAGCSYGPEVDAVLGLAHRYLPDVKVSITGVDSNPDALAEAEKPQYRLASLDAALASYMSEGKDFFSSMAAHGIGVTLPSQHAGPSISTDRLRAGHDVTWRQGDLMQGLPIDRLAHLVLCNNVLYHMSESAASMVTQQLVAKLAVGGVLGVGSNLGHAGMERWADTTSLVLREQGIERVHAAAAPSLVAFRRAA